MFFISGWQADGRDDLAIALEIDDVESWRHAFR
jgi:hypothetical protein